MTEHPARIVKRSLRIAGHATSISLEEPFWRLLRHAAAERQLGLAALVEEIDRERQGSNLSSAVRVHLLEWMMERSDLRPNRERGSSARGD
jgi:predicted DNA-binding ribbon-helix-helix protein